jgi:PAS domain S-box-containing protein
MTAESSARPLRGVHHFSRFADLTALAWFVLLVCIAGTLSIWYLARREAVASATLSFQSEVSDVRMAIERRMEDYISLLRGGGALFNAVGNISQGQWQRYVSSLKIGTHWPGMMSMGYVQMRAAASPDTAVPIKAGRVGEPYSRILYLESFSAMNRQAPGYDPFAEATRRAAMERARDSGATAVSAGVQLLGAKGSEGREGEIGLLIYVPVYAPGSLPETVEQRRRALHGFVYGVFRLSDLMRGVLGEAGAHFDFRLYDVAPALPEALLFDSQQSPDRRPALYTETTGISLPGRSWRLEMHGQPAFEQSLMSDLPTTVAIGGVLINLFLLVLAILLQESRRSHAQLRKLSLAVEQSPESVVITDTEACIEYVNEATILATGYRREELVGNNPRLLNSGHTPPATFVAMCLALKQGRVWQGELINRTKDGRVYVESATISPLQQPDGSITHYVAVKEDITEKKRMAEQLDFYRSHLEDLVGQRTSDLSVAREQADTANEAKSRFLASMSHEIRTPLNAVIGFAHLCLNLDLADRERGYLEKISSAAESLLGVVNDILDFSKADAGKLQLESIPFALSEVLQRVASLFSLATRNSGVELVVGARPGVADSLVGDPHRLGQVLINLVGNAVKFTERGEINLTVEPLPHGAGALSLRFSVSDTGPGMTPQEQALLFIPFSQADTSITRKHGGTGLGLALCKKLVTCMGGAIEVESEAGVGSCFSFSAVFASPVELPAARTGPSLLAGMKVLVVENSDAMRSLLTYSVKAFGCQVEAVDGGQAALASIGSGARFDFILMDWHMPGFDGLATARDIRRAGHGVPILLISGDEPALARASARELGVRIDAFLCKPVPVAMLHEAMLNALDEPAAPAATAARPNLAPALGGKRILIVDDNDFNRQVGRELVELTGATVDTANDGAQGVAAVADGDYDLVLMDIQMPVLDGHGAACRIRAMRRDLPIIALTSHALYDEQERALASGMNALLTKPILPALLYATLADWLGGNAGPAQTASAIPPGAAPACLPAPAHQERADVFDLAGALSRVDGDRPLLERFLRLFRERNAGIVDEIGAALARQDRMTARRLVHALKGGAATIGMVALHSATLRLEESLAPDAVIETARSSGQFTVLQAAWLQSLETLADVLDNPASALQDVNPGGIS